MKILSVSEPLLADWLRLRILLWPNTEDVHLIEMRQLLAKKQTLQFWHTLIIKQSPCSKLLFDMNM